MSNLGNNDKKFSKKILVKSLGPFLAELDKLAEIAKEYEEKKAEPEVTARKLIDVLKGFGDKFDKEEVKKELTVDRSLFPKEGELLAEGSKVRLNVIKFDEKEKYLEVAREYGFLTKAFEDEEYRQALWDDFLEEYSFVCSIFEKQANNFVGYCKIVDLSKEDWEFVIELEPAECHKGYGTEAVKLFLKEIYKLTGNRYFKGRVEDDNHIAQGFMKQLGGHPAGISEHILQGKMLKDFQTQHKDDITDEIRAVAQEFGVKAEDMMGCMLVYKFDVDSFMK